MKARVDIIWRFAATAISFVLFGIGGLVLAILVFPLFNLFVRDATRREHLAQQTVHAVWRIYIRLMVALGVLSFECKGADVLRTERGTLIIANHPSLLDIVFIMSLMDCTQCVVKSAVWHNPFMRGVVRATNYIPNLNDPERLIEDCARALRAGNNLVIFPEGSRTAPGQKRRYQRGFAYMALRAGAPIRLVTLQCDPPTLLKGEPWYAIPPRRPHWTIEVLERIDVAEAFKSEVPAIAVRRLCAQVERRIEDALAA